ncbi:MAG: hypothetical protein O3C57_01630 [Verrucomicrobia bacterium]|nr:hypothetical protein [Verrucomicrobiota bacterium]
MKTDQREHWVLMKGSGELGEDDAAALSEHLARDGELAAYARDANAIMSAARSALAVDGPAIEVITALTKRAAGELDLRPLPYARRCMKVLAYAATLAMAVGLWRFHLDAQRADRVGEIKAILGLAGTEVRTAVDPVAGGDSELTAMLQMLLQFEGLGLEDGQTGGLDLELLIPQEEEPPTALRWRSNLESLIQKYG